MYNKIILLDEINKGKRFEYLFFWGHQPQKDGSMGLSCFSQWFEAPFEVEGTTYKTTEHWMMAAKALLFKDRESFDKIISAESPKEVKALGRMIENFDSSLWQKESFDIVVQGNYYKFSQNQEMKNYLISTEKKVLVEASPLDKIWGIGLAADHENAAKPQLWKGENLLGFALMKVRDQLKMEESK